MAILQPHSYHFTAAALVGLNQLNPGVCSLHWILVVFHWTDFDASIVMLWKSNDRTQNLVHNSAKQPHPLWFSLVHMTKYQKHALSLLIPISTREVV